MKVERQSETDMIAENLERLDVYRYPFSFPSPVSDGPRLVPLAYALRSRTE